MSAVCTVLTISVSYESKLNLSMNLVHRAKDKMKKQKKLIQLLLYEEESTSLHVLNHRSYFQQNMMICPSVHPYFPRPKSDHFQIKLTLRISETAPPLFRIFLCRAKGQLVLHFNNILTSMRCSSKRILATNPPSVWLSVSLMFRFQNSRTLNTSTVKIIHPQNQCMSAPSFQASAVF